MHSRADGYPWILQSIDRPTPSGALVRLRVFLGFGLLALAISAAQLLGLARQTPWASGSLGWLAGQSLAVLGAGLVAVLCVASFTRLGPKGLGWVDRGAAWLAGRTALQVTAGIALGIAFPAIVLSPLGGAPFTLIPRLTLAWTLSFLLAVWLQSINGRPWNGSNLAGAWVMLGVAARAAWLLGMISDNPFSTGWSEASRYYYASLFLGRELYPAPLPLPVLHPSRYLLQAVPWLLGQLPLWVHRSWQVALWVSIPALFVWWLLRRLKLEGGGLKWLVVGWGVLFLFQGPVYYHLLVGVLPVIAGFDPRRPWRTLLWVALGSIWAGLSRVNWTVMPGLLAALLYLLEADMGSQNGRRLRQILWPILWVLAGTGLALGASAAYAAISGNTLGQFTSSFTSDLLWYRWLPNLTYPPGILLGALAVSLPIALLLGSMLRRGMWRPGVLQGLGVLLILGVLLAGGLVASVKIGGGGDLHNLDAYLTALLVLAGSVLLLRAAGWPLDRAQRPSPAFWMVWLAALVPTAFSLVAAGPLAQRNPAIQAAALSAIRARVEATQSAGGEILFLSQRHLVPLGEFGLVELQDDYEKVFVMEMAMGRNQAYLARFWDDLERQRFSLIVTDPVLIKVQGRSHPFGEENDVLVDAIYRPILNRYLPALKLNEVEIWLMEPR